MRGLCMLQQQLQQFVRFHQCIRVFVRNACGRVPVGVWGGMRVEGMHVGGVYCIIILLMCVVEPDDV